MNRRQLIQYIRSYVSPVVQYGVLLYGLGNKSRLQKILLIQKKLIRIVLRLPPWASVIEKFKKFRIGTVYEHHLYELFKFSLDQIRNGFKILNIGKQNMQTRNKNLNIWNFAEKNYLLDYRAIILTNALRKWGVLPSDQNICEMDEKQYKKFYHQIADLYIFGNVELVNIIYNKY